MGTANIEVVKHPRRAPRRGRRTVKISSLLPRCMCFAVNLLA
jgi:hypothetical protein